ncbi:ATP-dependent carboxylate-amine ligase domain protein ATP-grasp [Streptomyces davaonensis JCM 4913]|uniref:ATP-dependent carboxylate-amine ligase domain protein ATP-grasp n=1 Tax=Streptomyces davaonensis (strain DSM 101723 / JCM 4913 / KCC S-0913 / 768) TaxID=1214101 RepID=K4R658_STRDJ|nr:ATP-grasp domain-containing protein [Streptomyces davaonensis]CCK28607.1 ATP-dependent carboxylate-amine ligase domain protein ATP-grasp [Streptomyces davaonensis JCM 4913]
MPASNEAMILVVGSGGQAYREYLLAGARAHRPVWLLDSTEPTWQRPFVRGATVVELIDRTRLIPDQEALVKAALTLAEQHPIAGVWTYDETLVVATAHIAETLGLPGLSVAGAENCRNKERTRRLLTEAELPQPRFRYATSLDEVRAAALEFGFPVVLKPRGMGASIGVMRADDEAALSHAYEVAERGSHGGNPAYEGGVLVEEMLVGPEISVDGAIVAGEYKPFVLARKQVGLEPYFEETGHVVDAADPLLCDGPLLDVLTRAHRALGIRDGITHTEVKLTSAGPAIVEVNGRLGGGLIPYVGKLATGIDPALVAIQVATGQEPSLTATVKDCVGIRFGYPPQDGRVREVEAPRSGPGLVEAAVLTTPGALLLLPPRGIVPRFGYAICRGEGPDACAAALDAAEASFTLTLDPIGE